MTWRNGTNRPYSAQWQATKRHVLARSGGLCEVVQGGTRCGWPGGEVDHITPWHLSHDDSIANAQMICPSHHRDKTQTEARAARERIKAHGRRPVEVHPFDR